MKVKERVIGLVGMICVVGLVAAIPAKAALVISDSDISGDHYIYELTRDDMATSDKFDSDIFSRENISHRIVAPARFLRAAPGETHAEFVYKFDFSTTSYTPTQVVLRHRFDLYDATGQDVTARDLWSTDGTNWTQIREVSTDHKDPYPTGAPTETITFSTPYPSAFYYKVTFDANSGTFDGDKNEWNRSYGDPWDQFKADFTVIPEPATMMLLGLGGVGLLIRRRRRA